MRNPHGLAGRRAQACAEIPSLESTCISAAGLLRARLRVEQLEISAGSRASEYLDFRN
jgi:hypothetical protein